MKKNKIAFQGELGAYSHIAAKNFFKDPIILPCTTFESGQNSNCGWLTVCGDGVCPALK